MAVTNSKIQFGYTDNASSPQTFEVRQGLFGYQTIIAMNLDMQKGDDGAVNTNDNGAAFDKRVCTFDGLFTSTEQFAFLNAFTTDSGGRARDWTLTMDSDSGFFPFGPDKGDVGPFTAAVGCEIGPALSSPYKMYRNKFSVTNTGSYPAYSAPTTTDTGPLTIGTVTNLRFPRAWYVAKEVVATDVLTTEGSTSYWRNYGKLGDSWETNFEIRCSTAKAAALLAYLTGTARGGAFSILSTLGSYPFGRNKSSAGPFDVKLTSPILTVTHQEYNWFNIGLSLVMVADNG
jgi:hypothetical protein